MNEKYLRKLQQDMLLKNFTSGTREDYYRYVKKFLDFASKEAMTITYADIRRFIFHLKDHENKKASTINVYTAAIRFFFEYTLGYVWDSKKVPKMKRDRQLPVILTREQVNLLIDSMDNYKHKAMAATMYSSGLRVSEVCHLRYEDIRRKQKMIYVSLSKNRQDRYTILLNICYGKHWITDIRESFAGAETVMHYLGRYTHRIAISNSRILRMDEDTVTIRVKDYKNGGVWKELTLEGVEFVRRFLMHVPPKNFVRIRHYGLLSNHNKWKLIPLCRNLIGCREFLRRFRKADKIHAIKILYKKDVTVCPRCGGSVTYEACTGWGYRKSSA